MGTNAATACLVVAAFGLALAAYPPSHRNLMMYVDTHLAPALQGMCDVSDRLALVHHLALGVIVRMTALLALCWWLARRLGRPATSGTAATLAMAAPALSFIALGLCAAAPIAISPKVSGHYFLPAIPMFALGFASIARAFIASRVEAHAAPRPASRTSAAILLPAFVLASIITLVFALRPGRARDAVMLHDIDAIGRVMPRDITIGACRHPRSSRDWGLHTYAQRWFRVSLDARDMPVNGWLLRVARDCAAPPSCTPVARGDTLTLFRCQELFQHTSQ